MNALGMTETPEKGAMTTINCAVNPELAGVSGVYYINCKPAQPSRLARQVIPVQDGGACDTPHPLVYLYCPKKDANCLKSKFFIWFGGSALCCNLFQQNRWNDFFSISQDAWHSVFKHQLICKAWLLDNKVLAKICKIRYISFVLVPFESLELIYQNGWEKPTSFFPCFMLFL